MKQSVHGDDPVSQEILYFKKQREQADRIEKVFRQIKQTYSTFGIEEAKTKITSQFFSDNGIYNRNKGAEFFTNLRQNFANLILTSSNLQNHEIVALYETPQVPKQQEVKLPTPYFAQQRDPRPSQEPSLAPSTEKKLAPQVPQGLQIPLPRSPTSGERTPTVSGDDLGSTGGMTIQAGTKSSAKLSPDRSEIQITATVDRLTVERLKTIDIGVPGGTPTAFRAIDTRLIAIGYSDGALKVADTGDSFRYVRQYRFSSAITAIDLHDEDDPMIPLICTTKSPESAAIMIEIQRKQPHVVRFKHKSDVTAIVTLVPGRFATGTTTGEIHLWNKSDPESSQSIQGHSTGVISLAVLGAGKTLLSAGLDSTVRVFDVADGRLLPKTTFAESGNISLASAFHGNTKFAVFAVDNSLRVWNVADKE